MRFRPARFDRTDLLGRFTTCERQGDKKASAKARLILFILDLLFYIGSLCDLAIQHIAFFSHLLRFLPLFKRLFLIAAHEEDIAVMVYQLGAFGRIVSKRALYVYLGKRIVSCTKNIQAYVSRYVELFGSSLTANALIRSAFSDLSFPARGNRRNY